MFSTEIPYTEIQSIQPALTTFGVQIIGKRLTWEAQCAVKSSSGLHATTRKRATHKIEWSDVGSATVPRVAELLRSHQPLAWHFLMLIAQTEDRRVKQRPKASTIRHFGVCQSSYLT
ncbi:hypothetical protein L208DRAFT_1524391 [Tricholoma matsutake]|nr:hypothetical protein L208DRAFT_1524391 [Tricholoma matsutake 945]